MVQLRSLTDHSPLSSGKALLEAPGINFDMAHTDAVHAISKHLTASKSPCGAEIFSFCNEHVG
jgi:hypothetical protein